MREVTAHYEAGLGIRPPRRSGKVRGVAREIVPGGGTELWHCDHDHAPGVRDCQELAEVQRAEAARCARDWLARQIRDGSLDSLPVMSGEPLCPDGGYCHHECMTGCFRMACCEPLSGVFPGDTWPDAIRASCAGQDGVL